MRIKRVVIALVTVIALSSLGCGEKNVENSNSVIEQLQDESTEVTALDENKTENVEANTNESGNGAEVSEETEQAENNDNEEKKEETSSEPSEEDLYWQSVLEEFEDSRYDLEAALTGPALKDICADYFTLGVGINGSTLENQTLNIPEYMAVAKKHFNSCTMTNLMKSGYILDQMGCVDSAESGDGSPVLNFSTIDPTLQWCLDNGMKMRGHTLVWHAQAPDWFFRVGYERGEEYVDRDTMLFRMESYIEQLMTHVQENYPGVVYCWDVVNEAVDPDKGDRNSEFLCRMENDGQENPWYMTIGEDYVEMAFTFARKYAADGVKLFYNDFNTYQAVKCNAIVNLCTRLKEKNLIDGIGMQGYWGLDYPATDAIEKAIRRFAKLDLEIHITELSIGVDEETEEQFERQAKKYGSVFLMLRMLDTHFGGPANITNVTVFGLVDHYHAQDTTNARLFDKFYQPKPAFESIKTMMK